MVYLRILLCITLAMNIGLAQTVGTTMYSNGATDKFVLLNPVSGKQCFLLDNCGYIYNNWSSDFRPGMAAYMDEDGNLYRAGKIQSDLFSFGGHGGVIEKYDWMGDLLWVYTLANDVYHLHHDFEVLDNGNLLVVSWERIGYDELVDLGRITNGNTSVNLLTETIFEIDPNNDFNVVWQWRSVDHVIQDVDPGKANYGVVAENPQLLDINLNNEDPNNSVDWLHINSIDYNPELDQILLSCHGISEIIIIDHSTSNEESATHQGGSAGMGGDLLFRWGNPQNYLEDENLEQLLFSQHDANWHSHNTTARDTISLFNNGLKLNGLNYSTVNEILIERSNVYNYLYQGNELNQEADKLWTYNEEATEDLYSTRMSGVQHLPNGHKVICESDAGRIFEVDEEKKTVWTYINPMGVNETIFEQGANPSGNTLFQGIVYSSAYFNESVDLETDFERIELNPLETCDILATSGEVNQLEWTILASGGFLNVEAPGEQYLELFNSYGQLIQTKHKTSDHIRWELMNVPSGVYFVLLYSDKKEQLGVVSLYINSGN